MQQIDIYRTANLLIKQHGTEAEAEAMRRMWALIDADYAKGAGVWLAVEGAIKDLMASNGSLH